LALDFIEEKGSYQSTRRHQEPKTAAVTTQLTSGKTTLSTLDVQRTNRIRFDMIKSYRNQETEEFVTGAKVSKRFQAFKDQAERRVRILESATSVKDLAALRSNHFEKLEGDRKGQFSLRINEKWRICFEWPDRSNGPENVEIEDYH
jgi:toxin HigB-1